MFQKCMVSQQISAMNKKLYFNTLYIPYRFQNKLENKKKIGKK